MVGKTGGEQSGEELDLSGEQFGGHLICGGKPLTFLARGGGDKICAGKWGLVRRRERMCVYVWREDWMSNSSSFLGRRAKGRHWLLLCNLYVYTGIYKYECSYFQSLKIKQPNII